MLRHHVELGHVCTPFCPTFDMVADYIATPKPTHERHNARTMGDQTIAPPLTGSNIFSIGCPIAAWYKPRPLCKWNDNLVRSHMGI